MSAYQNEPPAAPQPLCRRCFAAGKKVPAERDELCSNCIKELQDNAAIQTPPSAAEKDSSFSAKPHPYARRGPPPLLRTPPPTPKAEPRLPLSGEPEKPDTGKVVTALERLTFAASHLEHLLATKEGRAFLERMPVLVRDQWEAQVNRAAGIVRRVLDTLKRE